MDYLVPVDYAATIHNRPVRVFAIQIGPTFLLERSLHYIDDEGLLGVYCTTIKSRESEELQYQFHLFKQA